MSIDRAAVSCPNSGSLWGSADHLIQPAFSGIWSNIFPKSPSPPLRFGQFSGSTDSKAFVGFGVSPDGSALHLSTAKYLTPKRVDLSEQGGVAPDIEVALSGNTDSQLDAAVSQLLYG